ncbi:DUF3883 domain-containing protein [Flavisolibacter sp. BT320]|nr:DUF3883 domain-containing protein [Flavisolibacter longurius]
METVTEILVDISGSMKNKMAAAKQILLNDILPELDYAAKVGIKTFTTTNGKLSIDPILPLSKIDKETISQKIRGITCSSGGTPIAATIKASVKSLSEYIANDKVIILVTDGAESEKGDYVLEAKRATQEGVECKIHVVGLDLKEGAIKQANEIAKITGGTSNFISISKGGYNQTHARASLTNFFQAAKATSTLAQSVKATSKSQNKPNTSLVSKPQPQFIEIKEEVERKVESSCINKNQVSTLGMLVEQIQELRKEIAALRSEKKQMPDVDEDPVENENVRKASEEFLYGILKRKYPDRVNWLNKDGKSNADHDFEILDLDGTTVEYYIECKGTPQNEPTFYLTKNEWRLFLTHTKNYQVYFVRNTATNPTYVFIDNLLDWVMKGKLVPYLKEKTIIKEERVSLTMVEPTFGA